MRRAAEYSAAEERGFEPPEHIKVELTREGARLGAQGEQNLATLLRRDATFEDLCEALRRLD
eukprot:1956729-Lingulodinium_polyedra.AAC.1